MVAEGEQGADRLGSIRLARECHGALQVLARLLRVSDPPEDPAEDAVGATRRPSLVEALGEPQGLLRGVDREHVVPGVHVEGGRFLVEPDELDARRAVLEQVDPALVVVDRRAPLPLVPERGADLPMQIGDAGEVLLLAVVGEAALPDADGGVDAPHSEGDVALLLADPGDQAGVDRLGELERGGVSVEGLGVRVEHGGGVAGGLEGLERLRLEPGERVRV